MLGANRTTFSPDQTRWRTFFIETTRCAADMSSHDRPTELSKTCDEKVSGIPCVKAPVWRSTPLEKPSPWPSSCTTTSTRSLSDPALASSP